MPHVIRDGASGTAYGARRVGMHKPAARMLAIDTARAMHLQARPPVAWWRQLSGKKNRTGYVTGDMEQMPFKESCTGLVWSNLSLQWCNDIKETFSEVHRVLQTGGL